MVIRRPSRASAAVKCGFDQGSQFTGTEFIGVLKDAKVKISMDGRGRWMDNVFIEMRWATVPRIIYRAVGCR